MITGADERIHPVEDPDARWSDAVSFSVWEPTAGLFLLARLAVLPNLPGATAGVLGWLGAKPVYAYGHAVDEAPLADWDDLAVAGLRVQELEALRSFEVNLADGGNGLSLRFDGVSGAVGYDRLPRTVAWGHYEQSCRVTGTVGLNGHDVRVDGVGQRSHTWGVRDPAAVAGWHVLSGVLGGVDRAFAVWQVDGLDGTRVVDGYVHDGGEDLRVIGAELDDLAIELLVEGGRRFGLRGVHHGTDVPVRPAGSSGGGEVLHQRLVRFESDDGLDGFGSSEVLEHPAPGS